MARTPISRLARTEVFKRISDPIIGWNPLIAEANTDYALNPEIRELDFSPKTKNFLFGQTTPLILEQTSAFRYPLICLYTHGLVNKNLEKFWKMAGQVVLGLDVWLSWEKSNGLYDYETYGDVVEEVVVEIVNGFGPSGNGETTQDWGSKVVYNGGVSCSRTDLALAADNWLQGLQFRLTFNVVTM